MATILERLQKWVESQPDKILWNFLNEEGKVIDSFTYQQLDSASTLLANQLLSPQWGLKAGDRALLVFLPGLQYAVTLIACFKASIIAVPVFPPDPRKVEKDIHHFVSIQASSGAQVALTHKVYNFNRKLSGIKSLFASQKKSWPELKWLEVDDIIFRGKSKPSSSSFKLPSLNSIAFLQYTSGSTSDPKGVMISHANLAHNESIIIKELLANQNTICVSWLPQYHDMGLIGSYLGLLYCGGTGYYISPIAFLKDPVLWIRAISLYKGTHTQAPNFAFALVTRKFKEAMKADKNYARKELQLDLSSVQNMLNAAEPLDEAAINNFYATFDSYGLRRGVVVPTYGLAEHTVFVCSSGRSVLLLSKADFVNNNITIQEKYLLQDGSGSRNNNTEPSMHAVVGCGFPLKENGVEVLIVSDSNEALPEDKVISQSISCCYCNYCTVCLKKASFIDGRDMGAIALQSSGVLEPAVTYSGHIQRLPINIVIVLISFLLGQRLSSDGRFRFSSRRGALYMWQVKRSHHRSRHQPFPAGYRKICGGPDPGTQTRMLGCLFTSE